MKTVIIISFTDLERDPRVYRQIQFLKNHYRVIAVGRGDLDMEGIQFIEIGKKAKKLSFFKKALMALQLIIKRYEFVYWQNIYVKDSLANLIGIDKDLVIANDIECLPLALRIAGNAKVILDAHEYAPRQFESSFIWRLCLQDYIIYLCDKYIPRVDAMITVSQGIAEQYERDTCVKPLVITNAPFYKDLSPTLLSNNRRNIRIIHHGGATRRRKLEKMIEMMDYLNNNFELNLMLVESSSGYIEDLKRKAKGKKNIIFIEPVPMTNLPEALNQYDIGIFILEPNTFNHLYVLPNKLFEFIQARLAIAIGPSPEMANIVRDFDCGIITEDFSPQKMANCLLSLDASIINYYKQRSHYAASVLNAEDNEAVFINVVGQVLQ